MTETTLLFVANHGGMKKRQSFATNENFPLLVCNSSYLFLKCLNVNLYSFRCNRWACQAAAIS